MATFRKRGNKWSYRIDMGRDQITNERIQATISRSDDYPGGFITKADAKAAAIKHQYELDHGTYLKSKDILFRDLITEWIKIYATTVKISSIRIRKYECEKLLTYFENHKAKDITRKMYQDALIDIKKEGISDNYLSGIHASGTMVFKYAIEFDYIKINPTLFIKLPKTRKTVEDLESHVEIPKYLEKEELNLFLDTARKHGLFNDYVMFLTMAYSGIRIGEMLALKKTDFDFTEQTLSITKTYYNPTNNALVFDLLTPKTKKSIRKIELESIVFEHITKHLSELNELKMRFRTTYYDKGFVFVDKKNTPGYPYYHRKVEARMIRLLKIAKLDPNLTPHSLRHTHTSLLAEAGVGLQEIMDRLGHKDDETTKNVYMHVTKSMKKEASQKFGNLMKNAKIKSVEV